MKPQVISKHEFTRMYGGDGSYPNPPAGVAAVLVNVGSDEPVVILIDLHDDTSRTVTFHDGTVTLTVPDEPKIEVAGPDDTLIGPPPPMTPEQIIRQSQVIQDFLYNRTVIPAIKEARVLTGLGLKEAKDLIDQERMRLGYL